ncbi:phasin [Aurantimonas sp. C2-6-R+9]|uniref:Phasin n=2 Tax=root TaxID=1 RepID=A0A9C9NKH5_9HYPH|nr:MULTISPECIES: phasin [unclassified Aurantimonas]MEC5291098.1 phasin [Aurantimonas sp. C2-3-R2]MEC5324899.1 phasin [Aurantimonas sp. A3-2-R12]MEC5381426.1 phasin [Aurantimonas sp. C2-6-R+9]MEC5412249.1 phasin [Aurantimonas sp. C2-4-R8]HDZ72733.1 phasin [Aurantimonas coralicida]
MADSKTNQDPFAMPNTQSMMGMDPSQMSETFRAMTQKSMEQSKEAYSRMKSAADEATKALESTMENAHQGSLQLSKKAIDALRSNAETGFQHLDKMMSAKSFAEVIEMQTAYVRKQIELATDQSKDMQALTQSVAQDMMKPGRDAFQKAQKNAK